MTTVDNSNKKTKITPEKYIEIYEKMLLVRRFEEKCSSAYSKKLINGFCHLYIGQEAVLGACDLVKRDKDSIITGYRCHAHAILCGIDPRYVMAELMGKSTGCSQGKGGSMHMFNKEGNFFGGHGIVGAQVPIGTGLAFAEKYRNTDNISFVFVGDGAVIGQGQVYEAWNMAALWKLPALYVIENNGYAIGTSIERATSNPDLYKRGEVFGIQGKRVNGMNLDEMHDALAEAADFVRKNKYPFIIEAMTYRYKGHSMSDPASYRPKDEVHEYKRQDPILQLRTLILDNQYIEEQYLIEIEDKVKEKVRTAYDFALNSDFPDPSKLYDDVYKNN